MRSVSDIMKNCCQIFSDIVENNYTDALPDEIESEEFFKGANGYRILIECRADEIESSKKLYSELEELCIKQFCEEKGIKELDYENDDLMDDYMEYRYNFFIDGLEQSFVIMEIFFYDDVYCIHIETSMGNYGQYLPFEKDMKFLKGNERAMIKKIKEIAEEIQMFPVYFVGMCVFFAVIITIDDFIDDKQQALSAHVFRVWADFLLTGQLFFYTLNLSKTMRAKKLS